MPHRSQRPVDGSAARQAAARAGADTMANAAAPDSPRTPPGTADRERNPYMASARMPATTANTRPTVARTSRATAPVSDTPAMTALSPIPTITTRAVVSPEIVTMPATNPTTCHSPVSPTNNPAAIAVAPLGLESSAAPTWPYVTAGHLALAPLYSVSASPLLRILRRLLLAVATGLALRRGAVATWVLLRWLPRLARLREATTARVLTARLLLRRLPRLAGLGETTTAGER